jgi:uncharacterized membrane protein HdeD (DUF308 family)
MATLLITTAIIFFLPADKELMDTLSFVTAIMFFVMLIIIGAKGIIWELANRENDGNWWNIQD